MSKARLVFNAAGTVGLAILLPLYFLFEKTGRDFPPAITHPEYYYGFAGVAVAWQIAFLLIARDPVRYRPFMIPAIVEKFSFGFAALVLLAQRRIPGPALAGGILDLIWGVLFLFAFLRWTPASR
jgi:hypothetical protein